MLQSKGCALLRWGCPSCADILLGVPLLALTVTRRQWATGHDAASWAMNPAGLPPLDSGGAACM
eukprot:5095655-Heterocapsa_arctica.AAC.1